MCIDPLGWSAASLAPTSTCVWNNILSTVYLFLFHLNVNNATFLDLHAIHLNGSYFILKKIVQWIMKKKNNFPKISFFITLWGRLLPVFYNLPFAHNCIKKYRLLKNDSYLTYNWLCIYKCEICSQIVVKLQKITKLLIQSD